MCQVYKLPGIYGQGIEWLGSSFVSMKVARGKAHSSRGGGGAHSSQGKSLAFSPKGQSCYIIISSFPFI